MAMFLEIHINCHCKKLFKIILKEFSSYCIEKMPSARTEDIVQLVEHLPKMHKLWVSSLAPYKPGVLFTLITSVLAVNKGKQIRAQGLPLLHNEFKAITGYMRPYLYF